MDERRSNLDLFLRTQGADFGLKGLATLPAWIFGRWIINLTMRGFTAALEKGRRIDSTLSNDLRSILTDLLNIVLVLAILDLFGVHTASFAVLLAGAGLALNARCRRPGTSLLARPAEARPHGRWRT